MNILAQTPARCNRCHALFTLPKECTGETHSSRAVRIQDFCTCPHCDMSDCHWVYTDDLTPIREVRFYNGSIEGYDTHIVFQCNFATRYTWTHAGDPVRWDMFEIVGGMRDDGEQNRWCESNRDWLTQWFPQVVADVQENPVENWSLEQEAL
jgi:hypothetical protein